MAKSTLYVYDHATGRWRKAGKWSKPPRQAQLRSDRSGNPIDANGKRVPLSAIAGYSPKQKVKPAKVHKRPRPKKAAKKPKPKLPRTKPKKRKPKPKAKRGTPVRQVSDLRKQAFAALPIKEPGKRKVSTRLPTRGAVQHIGVGEPITKRALISSRFDNARDPAMAGEVLFNNVARMSRKTGLEPDDLVLYQYGLEFVNTSASGRIEETAALVNMLSKKFPEFSYKYSEDSIHVNLGKEDVPVSRSGARHDLMSRQDAIVDIWAYISDMWDGDIGWFTWADNDDIEGGSG